MFVYLNGQLWMVKIEIDWDAGSYRPVLPEPRDGHIWIEVTALGDEAPAFVEVPITEPGRNAGRIVTGSIKYSDIPPEARNL